MSQEENHNLTTGDFASIIISFVLMVLFATSLSVSFCFLSGDFVITENDKKIIYIEESKNYRYVDADDWCVNMMGISISENSYLFYDRDDQMIFIPVSECEITIDNNIKRSYIETFEVSIELFSKQTNYTKYKIHLTENIKQK
jgi:hypothetical protein